MKPDGNVDSHQSVQELKAEIKTLRAFIDSSEAGMYVTDFFTGEILYANRKMMALGGNVATVDKVIGKVCWKLLNPEGAGRCSFCPQSRLLGVDGELLEPLTWENYFPRYGIWLKIISQALVWIDGRIAQMNTFYDITESKKMQEDYAALVVENNERKMQQNLQTVLDALPIAVRISDKESTEILYANKACIALFEYDTRDEMLGKAASDLIAPIQLDGVSPKEKLSTIFRSDKPTTIEVEYITSRGSVIDTRSETCDIEYSGKKCRMGIITSLAAEKEQRRLLESAAEKEKEANKLKSSFLSNMSHEIRTPMNAIIGLTEIELRKKHTEESLEVYKKVNISAKSLLQIVNDILDISKIEADKLEIYNDVFELEEVLNNAMLVVTPRLEGKLVELMPEISLKLPRYIIGDKTRLWQTIKNFLDNSAKYTQEGYIALIINEEQSRSTDEKIYISFVIEDTGIGMNSKQIEKAFLPYEQIYNDAQKRYTSTGLGLPLSKRICELMGGTMSIVSSPGQGTTVCLTIPFERSARHTATMQDVGVSPLAGLKVLVVDDSELTLRVAGTLLRSADVDCIVARSGEEAVRLVQQYSQFDIVVLDYVMKGENGLDTAKKLREYIPADSKILLATAYGSQIDRDVFEESGVSAIIEKPFSPSTFYNKLLLLAGNRIEEDGMVPDGYVRFKNAKILVCEDNDINQQVAAGMLEQFGIEPVLAGNGEIGIEMLKQSESIDLILMDIHMPVMDGYKATQEIRRIHKYDNIPIVSLTADAMSEVIDQCFAVGMNDYLSKPFEMNTLHELLLKWLPLHKRET